MYKPYLMGEITLHVAQIVNTKSYNTIYPRKMVCFRYIIVNTLHKVDNKDDGGGYDDDDNVYGCSEGNTFMQIQH
jgi:hypothetical protein